MSNNFQVCVTSGMMSFLCLALSSSSESSFAELIFRMNALLLFGIAYAAWLTVFLATDTRANTSITFKMPARKRRNKRAVGDD